MTFMPETGSPKLMKIFQSQKLRFLVLLSLIFGANPLFLITVVHAAEPMPSLNALSRDEMDFLLKNCPDTTRIVSSGVVVAYGEIVEAPMLVTIMRDKIDVNNIQVVPAQERDANFEANKIAGRIHSQLYRDEQKGLPDAYALAEQRIRDYKASGRIDDFQGPKPGTKSRTTDIFWRGEQSAIHANLAPWSLLAKYWFIVDSIFFEYEMKKESEGREKAQQWLQARLEDMKALGVIARFEFIPIDAVNISYPGSVGPRGYNVGDYKSPHGIEYTKSWKSKKSETKAKADRIVAQLNANRVLIYSFSFEKSTPYNPGLLNALRSFQQGRDAGSDRQIFKKQLVLTDEQAKALAEELR